MPKRNPQKSHHEWTEIHLATIRRIVEIEKEKEAVVKNNVKLQEEKTMLEKEKAMLEEEKVAREKECEELKKENLALLKKVNNLEDVTEKIEEAERFLAEKQTRVLVSGDFHLKCIPLSKLANATGKEVSFLKTYCSRNFWPNALKPTTSISSVLLQHVNSREAVLLTHLLMTAPISDVSNLLHMGTSARMNWVEISVKSMIVTAKMCLIRHPGLQKVFIMEHLPR